MELDIRHEEERRIIRCYTFYGGQIFLDNEVVYSFNDKDVSERREATIFELRLKKLIKDGLI